MADPKGMEDKMMAAMNGPGDTAKLSVSAAEALKKATGAKAREGKKLRVAKKQPAKIIPLKKPAAKKSPVKTVAPIGKAAANKKVARKTMKTGKKTTK
jgi:hypothetical protein